MNLNTISLADAKWYSKIMNGDITLAALCYCQRASKLITPFINLFLPFSIVSFRRYNL